MTQYEINRRAEAEEQARRNTELELQRQREDAIRDAERRRDERDRAEREALARQRSAREAIEQEERRLSKLREEEERRLEEIRQIAVHLGECRRYVLTACDAALKSPKISDSERKALLVWQETARQYQFHRKTCQEGSASSCNTAIESPAASDGDRELLMQWRAEASPYHRTIKFGSEAWSSLVEKVRQGTRGFVDGPVATGIALVTVISLLVFGAVGWRRILPNLGAALAAAASRPATNDVGSRGAIAGERQNQFPVEPSIARENVPNADFPSVHQAPKSPSTNENEAANASWDTPGPPSSELTTNERETALRDLENFVQEFNSRKSKG